MDPLVTFLGGVLAVGLPAAALWTAHRLRLRRRSEAEAAARGRIVRVDDRAAFRGAIGATAAPGSGCLVLTDQELLFVPWVPRDVLRIDHRGVVGVDRVRSHLGHDSAAPLLRVTFRDGAGQVVKAAWTVRDPDDWARVLEGMAPNAAGRLSPPTL